MVVDNAIDNKNRIINNSIKKPTNDIVFQLIFGKNKNKHLTDSFIKSIFNYIGDKSELNNINIKSEVSLEKNRFNDKTVRLDILAKYDNHIVCIEMQNTYNSNIYNRARCYFAKVCAEELERGEDYINLKPITMIVILNEDSNPKLKQTQYLQDIVTVDNEHRDKVVNIGIKFIFIVLPRLKNNVSLDYDIPFIQWLKFLEYRDMGVIDTMCKKNTAIKEANEELLGISAEEEERRWQRFYDNGDLELRLTYSEGVDAGREEGRTEGEVSGRLKAFMEMAKKLLAEKYPVDKIKELTGLSEKQINELAESI